VSDSRTHHWSGGWSFTRLPDGSVHVVKRAGPHAHADIETQASIPALEWCSIVAAMSRDGDTSATYLAAKHLHVDPPTAPSPYCGREMPCPHVYGCGEPVGHDGPHRCGCGIETA
jgi:hypothetical protein